MVVIFSPKHRWKNKKKISFEEFIKEPLIVRERGSGTRKVFMDIISKKSATPLNIIMELGNTEAIKKSAQAGLGVAVVSKSAIEAELLSKKLRFTVLDGYQFERRLTLIILKNRYLSNPLKAFMSILDPAEKMPGTE